MLEPRIERPKSQRRRIANDEAFIVRRLILDDRGIASK